MIWRTLVCSSHDPEDAAGIKEDDLDRSDLPSFGPFDSDFYPTVLCSYREQKTEMLIIATVANNKYGWLPKILYSLQLIYILNTSNTYPIV
jgi:hypothetical protein